MQNMEKDMCLEKCNKVVMHNNLIKSKSNLSLNEVKLLRLTIMQVIKQDDDFKTYKVSIKNLADILEIDSHNVYRDLYVICNNLMNEKIYMGDEEYKTNWKIFHWCSSCEYANGMLTIRLHDDLKPYLLELSGLYTQYVLQDILSLKSVYSVRIYELLVQELKNSELIANEKKKVYLSVESIRISTNTVDKYKDSFSMFEKRIVASSINEINEKLEYYISYSRKKESRKVVGFWFNIQRKTT